MYICVGLFVFICTSATSPDYTSFHILFTISPKVLALVTISAFTYRNTCIHICTYLYYTYTPTLVEDAATAAGGSEALSCFAVII